MKSLAWAVALAVLPLPAVANNAIRINAVSAEQHVRFLADAELKGRMTLSAGEIIAAEYIEKQFKRFGVQPGGTEGYLHRFEITANQRFAKMNAARFWSEEKEWVLDLGKDWVPLAGSKNQSLTTGSVTFVGKLRAAQVENVAGQWIMMYRTPSPGERPVSPAVRATEYAQKGAKGIIYVGPSMPGGGELPKPVRTQGISAQAGVVGIGISKEVFESLSGMKFGTEVEAPKLLNVKLRAITDLEANRGMSRNVIGVLPGNDPKLKDEFIVIGGHYDHIGFGETGSRTGADHIHYGADDNASGTAGVLTLAEYFASSKSNRRTIIFQLYSGEELGLVGSRAWVRDNPEKVSKIHMMLNLDMIGRLREGALTAFCVDSAPQFESLLNSINVEGVKFNKVMNSPGNSDHAAFIASRVPSLFLHTGLHEEYHTENDDLGTLNYGGMATVIEAARLIVEGVDQIDEKLAFTARQQGGRPASGDPSAARRVRVGFIPDMGDADSRGMRITGATPGSPAEAAGVKAGDILVSFDGKPIKNIEDLQGALSGARAGVEVIVIVIRGNQQLTLKLTPTAPQ